MGNLVNKDTDLDGVLDWEERLWGTDPIKKDTNGDGMPDSVEIENLKKQAVNEQGEPSLKNEELTETDKFSRELFATVATLNQNGAMDQATVDKLSASLEEKIQNSPQKKIYTISNLKIINDDTSQAMQKYIDTLNSIYAKYRIKRGVFTVLQEFIKDENNIIVLSGLDPILSQMNKITSELVKMNVPKSLSLLHLDFINSYQRVKENISDMKLFESDTIVALSAVSQYEKNATVAEASVNKLIESVRQKLKN